MRLVEKLTKDEQDIIRDVLKAAGVRRAHAVAVFRALLQDGVSVTDAATSVLRVVVYARVFKSPPDMTQGGYLPEPSHSSHTLYRIPVKRDSSQGPSSVGSASGESQRGKA